MQFTYKITKFDIQNKVLVVTFGDGHWAEIRLSNPLPANIADLEKIISRYTAPVEVVEAQQAPSADLSYIEPLVEVERTAERFSLAAAIQLAAPVAPAPTVTPAPAPEFSTTTL